MGDFPIMLKVRGRKCVVVGGGPVAVRRARALAEAGGEVVVVAMEADPELVGIAVAVHLRKATEKDLDGAMLVVLATGDVGTNERLAEAARVRGVLVNRADAGDEGDFAVPAHKHVGPVTVAVHTSGVSASAAVAMRDELLGKMDGDWVKLLELVMPYREKIQGLGLEAGERQRRLKMLGSAETLAVFKAGGAGAVVSLCEGLVGE